METVKLIVSGAYKEKALLANILGNKLANEGFNVTYSDLAINSLVTEKFEDCSSELKESLNEVVVVVENLLNTNVTEDLTKLYNELSSPRWDDDQDNWNNAVAVFKEKIGQILLL